MQKWGKGGEGKARREQKEMLLEELKVVHP